MSVAAINGADDRPAETAVRAIGERLLEGFPTHGRSPRRAFEENLMARLAEDPATKAALFRLVDVAPMCRNRHELSAHLAALLGEIDQPPRLFRATGKLAGSRVGRTAVGTGTSFAVKAMASRFIAGDDVDSAAPELRRLWDSGVASTVDLLGEATVTEAEADAYERRCAGALEALAKHTGNWPAGPAAEDGLGPIPRANLSIKISALTPHARSDAPWRGIETAGERLRRLLRKAQAVGAHLHIDMESLDLRETVTGLVFALLDEPEFRDGPSAGMVLQAYLRDSPAELERWLDWARSSQRHPPLKIRLVKGAYWDHELVQAQQAGWPTPVFEDRASCDRNYESLTRRLVRNGDVVRVAIASHNVRSVAHAIAVADSLQPPAGLELQVLRGLGDDLQATLAQLGYRVRTYCPVGDLVAGMAYLVRRLLENTSNDSFLRTSAAVDDPAALLAAP